MSKLNSDTVQLAPITRAEARLIEVALLDKINDNAAMAHEGRITRAEQADRYAAIEKLLAPVRKAIASSGSRAKRTPSVNPADYGSVQAWADANVK